MSDPPRIRTACTMVAPTLPLAPRTPTRMVWEPTARAYSAYSVRCKRKLWSRLSLLPQIVPNLSGYRTSVRIMERRGRPPSWPRWRPQLPTCSPCRSPPCPPRELLDVVLGDAAGAQPDPDRSNTLRSRALAEQGAAARIGAKSWPEALRIRLRISGTEARRRYSDALNFAPRISTTGESLPPLRAATAAAQAGGWINADHIEILESFFRKCPPWVDAVGPSSVRGETGRRRRPRTPPRLCSKRPTRRCTCSIRTAPNPPTNGAPDAVGSCSGHRNPTGCPRFAAGSTPNCVPAWKPSMPKRRPQACATPTTRTLHQRHPLRRTDPDRHPHPTTTHPRRSAGPDPQRVDVRGTRSAQWTAGVDRGHHHPAGT